jgi:hypothetical protein
MAIFNSYVKLPEGTRVQPVNFGVALFSHPGGGHDQMIGRSDLGRALAVALFNGSNRGIMVFWRYIRYPRDTRLGSQRGIF